MVAMGRLNVKNGTPVGNAHLCKSCTWGHFIAGYRESDQLAICNYVSPNLVVPFVVHECTEFSDKFKPTFEQMSKLAIDIQPTRASARTAGFSTSEPLRPVRVGCPDEDEDEDEAALGRGD